jgi:hypothetical protein
MKNLLTIVLLLIFVSSYSNAQNVAINTDGSNANSDAILHLKSSSKGLLIPSMTSAQRTAISNVSDGLMVYDTQTNSFWYRDAGTWNEILAGDIDLSTLEDGDANTKIQVEEGANDNQIRFDIDGSEQLVIKENANGQLMIDLTQASGNTSMGEDAGLNVAYSFPDGINNSYFGQYSGKANVSGSYNSFFGKSAGTANTSGDWNTFIGAHTAQSMTTGTSNTMIGFSSGSNQISGDQNTYVGEGSGSNKTGGDNNTFLGYRSGRLNTTGSNNVFIGYQAGATTSSSNRLMIDNSSTSSPLIDGDFSSNELTVNGDLEVTDVLTISSSATSSPTAGSIYSNSGPLAYGRIGNSGLISTDYGITSVTKTATGVYEVVLDNSFNVSPVVLVTPSSTVVGSVYSATYFTTSPNIITVNINNEAGVGEDQPFSMMVMGW